MRPFKLFWGWTKNTSSSPAQGFFCPFLCPKIFPSYIPPPSYLPHLISRSLHFQSSGELPSLSSTELRGDVDTRLEEGGELNAKGMWRGESKRSASSQMQKQKKKGKLPPFFAYFFFSTSFFFVLFFSYVWKKKDAKRKRLKRKGRSKSQKWEGKARAWR